jgi:hypothetical protein
MTTRSELEKSVAELFFGITLGAFVSFFVVFVGLFATLSEGYTELLEWPNMLIFVAVPAFVFWLFGRKSKWSWEVDGRFPLLIGVAAGMTWAYCILERDYGEKELLYCGYISPIEKSCVVHVRKQGNYYYIRSVAYLPDMGEKPVEHFVYDQEGIDSHEFKFDSFGCILFDHVRFNEDSPLSSSTDESWPDYTVYLVTKVEELKNDPISDEDVAIMRAHLRSDAPLPVINRRAYMKSKYDGWTGSGKAVRQLLEGSQQWRD